MSLFIAVGIASLVPKEIQLSEIPMRNVRLRGERGHSAM